MTIKSIVLILLFLLCLIHINQAYKHHRRTSLASSRRDYDGFSFFGKSSRRERKSYEEQNNFIYRHSGRSHRKNNVYAAKKFNQFSSKAKTSFTSMIRSLFNMEEEEPKIISGKRIKNYVHEEESDWTSFLIVTIVVTVGFSVVYYLLTVRPFDQDELSVLRRRRQDRNKETFKNYEKLKFIEQNGVHPDVASGKIYQIKL